MLRRLALRLADVRGAAEDEFGAFHDRLGQRWVRVDAFGDVTRHRGHLDGQYALGNQLAGPGADNAHAQHALRTWLDDELGQTVGPGDTRGAAARGPGELHHLDGDILVLR